MKELFLTIELPLETKVRLDKYVASLGICSRSQLTSFNMQVYRTHSEDPIRFSTHVKNGDELRLCWEAPELLHIKGEPIELDIYYEDDNIIVLNKPQGLVVHPGSGHHTGTLVQGLMYYLTDLRQQFPEDDIRPGIVHRLDKDTSGLLVTAKNIAALNFMSQQFMDQTVKKQYLAVIKGHIPAQLQYIESFIRRSPKDRKKFESHTSEGRQSYTTVKTLKKWPTHSLVLLQPKTGRTHQLRVHLQSIGCPILGDPIYSRKDSHFPDASLHLHAFSLSFKKPFGEETLSFKTKIPERLADTIRELNQK